MPSTLRWFNYRLLAQTRAQLRCRKTKKSFTQQMAAEDLTTPRLRVTPRNYQRYESGEVNQGGFNERPVTTQLLLQRIVGHWGIPYDELVLSADPDAQETGLDDQCAGASPLKSVMRRTNLPPRNEDFVGRCEELALLRMLLRPGEVVALSQAVTRAGSLTGMGGVGKTQLAIEYAYRHIDDYESICFVDADGDDISAGFASLAADPLGLPAGSELKTAELVACVKARLEQGGPHLLILDNVEDPQAWRKVRPGPDGGVQVLITTRRSHLKGTRELEVEVLPRADALKLLLGGPPTDPNEERCANNICERLGDLALAISIARALLKNPFLGLGDLLAEVERVGPVQWSEGCHEIAEELAKSPSLVRLFDASLGQLRLVESVDRVAHDIFLLSCWLAPVEVRLRLLAQGARQLVGQDAGLLSRALGRLVTLGLVREGDRGGVYIHRILREYGRQKGGERYRAAMLELLQESVDQSTPEAMMAVALEPLRPHLEEALTLLRRDDKGEHFWIPICLVQHLNHRGEHEAAQWVAEQGLTVCREPLWRSTLFNERGQAFHYQGLMAMAARCYNDSLEAFEAAMSAWRPETLEHFQQVGRTLGRQIEYSGVMEYYERDLLPKKVSTGKASTHQPKPLDALGQAFVIFEPHDAEVRAVERVFQAVERAFGGASPEAVTVVVTIGQVTHRQGAFRYSVIYYTRALQWLEGLSGVHHAMKVTTLTARGRTYTSLGLLAEAEQDYRLALELQLAAGEGGALGTAVIRAALGQVAHRRGDYLLAIQSHEKALRIKVRLLSTTHASVALTWCALGQVYCSQAAYDDAKRCLNESLEIFGSSLGGEHPSYAVALASKAQVLALDGDVAGAVRAFHEAARRLEDALGINHPTTQAVQMELDQLH